MCHFQVSSHCCWVSFCHRVLADYGPPIAAARPLICHGPPYRAPHAAARPLICHGPPYRLVTLLLGPTVCHGSLYRLHCCCLHRHTLPCATFSSPHTPAGFHFVIGCWADYRPPIGAARPQICHGPPYRLVTLLLGPQCVMGPCTASYCCCLHRHTLPCATFSSPHT
ncbi:unnamed protein product, partial [Staurois parvus]